jgi:hypothetical protein
VGLLFIAGMRRAPDEPATAPDAAPA